MDLACCVAVVYPSYIPNTFPWCPSLSRDCCVCLSDFFFFVCVVSPIRRLVINLLNRRCLALDVMLACSILLPQYIFSCAQVALHAGRVMGWPERKKGNKKKKEALAEWAAAAVTEYYANWESGRGNVSSSSSFVSLERMASSTQCTICIAASPPYSTTSTFPFSKAQFASLTEPGSRATFVCPCVCWDVWKIGNGAQLLSVRVLFPFFLLLCTTDVKEREREKRRNGRVLDQCLFIHHVESEWNVFLLLLFFSAILPFQAGFNPLNLCHILVGIPTLPISCSAEPWSFDSSSFYPLYTNSILLLLLLLLPFINDRPRDEGSSLRLK